MDAATLQPLAGAQIAVEGTSQGTISDAGGRFVIRDLQGSMVTLQVIMLGYRPLTRTVGVGATDLRLALRETAIELGEIVVTGTVGGMERRALGNSIAKIEAEEVLAQAASPDLGQLINGRAAGVVVQPGTGIVGAGPKINIRGTGTFSLSGEPLIYIDGVRVANDVATGPEIQLYGSATISRLNDINPEDIESIEVIRGPAAATLYGTEASNGVIQIITKKGQPGERPSISVRVKQGANWFSNAEGRFPTNFQVGASGEVVSLNLAKEEAERGNPIFRTGHAQGYGVDVSGGSETFQYYVGVDYDKEEGVDPRNEARKFNARTNLTVSPHETLDMGANIGFLMSKTDLSREEDTWLGFFFSYPTLKDEPDNGFLFPPPDVARQAFEDFQEVRHVTAGFNVEHRPTDWFSQRLTVGVDLTEEDDQSIIQRMGPSLARWYGGATALGSKNARRRELTQTTLDYSGTFKVPLGATLESATSVGVQYYTKRMEFVSAEGREFPARGLTTLEAAAISFGSDDFEENSTLGSFIQEQFAWRDRLFLTAAVRADDNSAFGSNFDVVTYPKFSATWVLSDEEFWNVGLVNTLKLRAAWGQSGQQPETFAALRAYAPISTGSETSGVIPKFIGNPDLAPERGEEIELGFEAGILDERAGIDFTFYNSTTRDAILLKDVPPSSGFAGQQFVNAGKIRNRGVEVELNTRPVETPTVAWDLDFHLATNSNEVLDLGGEQFLSAGSVRHPIGYPVGSWFGKKVVSAELDADFQPLSLMCDGGPENGGRPMPCDDAPRVFLGRSVPKYEGGLSSTVSLFDRLRLFASIDFKTGFKAYDFNLLHRCATFRLCRITAVPQDYDPLEVALVQSGSGSPYALQYAVRDQGFFKLREFSASYILPERWLSGFGASRASVTVAGRNLYTWSDWTGLDPENSFVGFARHGRYEWLNTPQLAQFVTTLRLWF